jgi:transcription antitermination factor NusG
MDTLTNVQVFNDAPSAVYQGVQLRFAPNPEKQWFVIRATYNRQDRAYDFLVSNHTEAFLPMHYTQRLVDGQKRRLWEPLLPNLLFVYATPEVMDTYVRRTPQLGYINYYYNHFKTVNGVNPPLTIPYEDMMNFIHVLSVENEHVMVVEKERCHYKSGEEVLVTQGEFEGVHGKVVRVAGQQRVVVNLEGLCLVATAYIPSAFLKTL